MLPKHTTHAQKLVTATTVFAFVLMAVLLTLLNRPGDVSGYPGPGTATPTTAPHGPANLRVYLPLVLRGLRHTGLHIGNRNADGVNNDWISPLLQRIDPNFPTTFNSWPGALVVLSQNVYTINRYAPNDANPALRCRVQSVAVARPIIFDYIKRAVNAGVPLIIRIYPSPGNFSDWSDPLWQHHQLSPQFSGQSIGPLNGSACAPDKFRTAQDVIDEINAIHNFNAGQGFAEAGFEPANEPNAEWYTTATQPPSQSDPYVDSSTTWSQMSDYFTAIYAAVPVNTKVFTPPMSQWDYAEGVDFGCNDLLVDGGATTGYEVMRNYLTFENDGVDWHNYWRLGREKYDSCRNGSDVISHDFPSWLLSQIQQGGGYITEADLSSPSQFGDTNPLKNKVSDWLNAEFSLQKFAGSELNASKVVVWLINDNTNKGDHNWHEAYDDSQGNFEYLWYQLWWASAATP